jgi:hypothetical protein
MTYDSRYPVQHEKHLRRGYCPHCDKESIIKRDACIYCKKNVRPVKYSMGKVSRKTRWAVIQKYERRDAYRGAIIRNDKKAALAAAAEASRRKFEGG